MMQACTAPSDQPPDLRPLLAPRSIAIVGASDRPGPSSRILASLKAFGFPGAIMMVNPGRDHALGQPCAPSLASLPTPLDAALLCIGPAQVADAVIDAAAAGVKAVVCFASGVQHTRHGGRPSLDVIRETCARAGIAFCGPDCMGVLNPVARSTLYLSELLDPAPLVGDVGLITQSGSMAIGLLTDCRRFGYSHVISTGAEAVLDAAHYLAALVDDPDTRVIALFLEAVRNMDRFVAALMLARDRGKPVVVLKVGKTEASRQAALGHTGGIAGDARVFSALLRRHGCVEVTTLEELTETIACLRAARRPRHAGIGIVTPSGGHVEYALDTAARARISLPPMPAAARAELATVMGPFTGPGNPVDAWGNGDFQTNLTAGLTAFAGSPDHGAVVLISDQMDGQPTRPTRYVDLLLHAAARSDKPFYLLSARAGLFRRDTADRLAANGACQLSGVEPSLRAIANVAAWRTGVVLATRVAESAADPCADLPAGDAWLNEAAAKNFLSRRRFAVPAGTLVDIGGDLTAAASNLGFPVAIKVIDDGIPHRTPYGLVALDLRDAAALHAAARKIRENLAIHFPGRTDAPLLVERMTPPGLDLIVAATTDPECGPMLTLGLGGFLLEAVRDVVAVPLPSRQGEVAALLETCAIGRLLASPSGAAFGGIAPVAQFAEAIGDTYVAAGGRLSLIELNPVRLAPGEAAPVILDALIASKGVAP
jgi:acyl-CoA synthetase (NDP forming)